MTMCMQYKSVTMTYSESDIDKNWRYSKLRTVTDAVTETVDMYIINYQTVG